MSAPTQPAGSPSQAALLHEFLLKTLKGHWRNYRRHFASCQRKVSKKSVHAFRVDSRRLLSTSIVLSAVTPGRPLKDLGRSLVKRMKLFSRLRDAHVQLVTVEKMEGNYPEIRSFRRRLDEKGRRLLKRTTRKIRRKNLRDIAEPLKAIRKEMRSLLQDTEQEEQNLKSVRSALQTAYADVIEQYCQVDLAKPETIHALRIAFKRFRYMMEAIQQIQPAITEHLLERMHDYQTHMGHIQDNEVLRASLKKFLKRRKHRHAGLGKVDAELERQRRTFLDVFVKKADEVLKFMPRELRAPSADTAARKKFQSL